MVAMKVDFALIDKIALPRSFGYVSPCALVDRYLLSALFVFRRCLGLFVAFQTPSSPDLEKAFEDSNHRNQTKDNYFLETTTENDIR